MMVYCGLVLYVSSVKLNLTVVYAIYHQNNQLEMSMCMTFLTLCYLRHTYIRIRDYSLYVAISTVGVAMKMTLFKVWTLSIKEM